MGADDDFYDNFQCQSPFWDKIHLDLLYSDGGNIYLGVSRILSFLIIFGLNWYNRKLLRKKASENVNVVPGIVLPTYFLYIYIYIFLSLFAGILDLSLKGANYDVTALNWIIPLEQGLFHWLYEGLALFLVRYGAGVKAIQRSLVISAIWGMISFVFYFFLYTQAAGTYGTQKNRDNAFSTFIAYESLLFGFYLSFLVVPQKYLYRRSALDFYAKFNVLLYGSAIILGSLLDNNVTDSVCAGSVIIFILVAFIQPFALFHTLQIDSQYWQGLKPDKGNPLAEVWDHVDIKTAETMAENLETVNTTNRSDLPILHFGLFDFNESDSNSFVAGGFSRVYFARYRGGNSLGGLRSPSITDTGTTPTDNNTISLVNNNHLPKDRPEKGVKVAFKILFAMELTPDDVQDFYREAILLSSLKHENIVLCKGICVMPPALAMVLEYCRYGSLFDFLHKPMKDKRDSYLSDRGSHSSVMMNVSGRVRRFWSSLIGLLSPNRVSEDNYGGNDADRSATQEMTVSNPIRGSALMVAEEGGMYEDDDDLYGNYDAGGSPSNANSRKSAHSSARPTSTKFPPLDISKVGGDAGADNITETTNPLAAGTGGPDPFRPTMDSTRASSTGGWKRFSVGSSSRFSEAPNNGERNSILFKTYETISGILSGNFSNTINSNQNNSSLSERGSYSLSYAAALPLTGKYRMMRDAIKGIQFLHSKGYMHCDIKSLNFLVDDNYRVKLADMGEVRPIVAGEKKYRLPPIPARNWAPPEVIPVGAKPEVYTTASEVYGLTIVLCEIASLEVPFGDIPDRLTGPQWFHKLTVENLRPTIPSNVADSLRDILTRGMSSASENRPLVSDLLNVIEECIANPNTSRMY